MFYLNAETKGSMNVDMQIEAYSGNSQIAKLRREHQNLSCLPWRKCMHMANLSCDLEQDIVMYEQPEGFVIHGQEDKVCKLNKSLYGLKQEPK